MDPFAQNSFFEMVEMALDRVSIDETRIQFFITRLKECEGEEAERLLYACQDRLLDAEIDKITDGALEAEEDDVAALREAIEEIVARHALSMENRQMLLLARRLLQKIAPDGESWELPKSDASGALALEIAYALYKGNRREARELLLALPAELGAPEEGFAIEWPLICRLVAYATGETVEQEAAEALFRDLDASICDVCEAE